MHAFVMTALPRPHRMSRGFTLIELMTVVTIAAILLMLGLPLLTEFIADQRVRTVASDIAAEIAFARAKAIEASRRVNIEMTGASWNNGWRIYVDQDDSGTFTPGGATGDIVLKVFDGFPPGRMYLCSTVAGFATRIVFRPDGRVVRTPPVLVDDGIYIVDTMGGIVQAKYKIRGLLFGLSGRVTVVKKNGDPAPC